MNIVKLQMLNIGLPSAYIHKAGMSNYPLEKYELIL